MDNYITWISNHTSSLHLLHARAYHRCGILRFALQNVGLHPSRTYPSGLLVTKALTAFKSGASGQIHQVSTVQSNTPRITRPAPGGPRRRRVAPTGCRRRPLSIYNISIINIHIVIINTINIIIIIIILLCIYLFPILLVVRPPSPGRSTRSTRCRSGGSPGPSSLSRRSTRCAACSRSRMSDARKE